MIAGPVKFESAEAGGAGHACAERGIVTEPFHPLGQSIDVARWNDEPFDAVADDRAGAGRDDTRQAAGQGLVGHDGRAFEERWKHEDVGCRHARGHLGMSHPAQRLDQPEIRREWAEASQGNGPRSWSVQPGRRICRQASSRYLIPLR